MTTTHDEPPQKLERLAQEQLEVLTGPSASCWEMVVFGVHYGMLDANDLQEAIDALERGNDFGSEEIGFEPWEEQIRVSYFQEVNFCSFEEMMKELQRLLDAYHRPD